MPYSKSVFFVPVLLNDFVKVSGALRRMEDWEQFSHEELKTNYLLYYAARISQDDGLFISCRYKGNTPDVYLFEGHNENKMKSEARAELSEIRFSAFSTDVGFLEFHINYENADLDDMRSFAYLFKKSTKGYKEACEQGKQTLFTVVRNLCAEVGNAEPFFTATVDFKSEALGFHYANLPQDYCGEETLKKQTLMLARSYSDLFEKINTASDYDMHYMPASYDHWSGSTEGLVNVTCLTGDANTDFYLSNPGYKRNQLDKDIYFIYLLLLNQRFASIKYINEVAVTRDEDAEKLSHKILKLKTVFSFRVISDDRVCQNVYARMYKLLDIDALIEDIKDNESQMDLIWNKNTVSREKITSAILFALSLLALFSALIDASTFVDRFGANNLIATSLGIAFPLLAVAVGVIFWFKKK